MNENQWIFRWKCTAMSILTTFYLYIAQLTIHWKILKIHRTGRCYRQSKKGFSVIKEKKMNIENNDDTLKVQICRTDMFWIDRKPEHLKLIQEHHILHSSIGVTSYKNTFDEKNRHVIACGENITNSWKVYSLEFMTALFTFWEISFRFTRVKWHRHSGE